MVQAGVPTFYILLFYIRSSTLLAGPLHPIHLKEMLEERRDVLFQLSTIKYNNVLAGISNYLSGQPGELGVTLYICARCEVRLTCLVSLASLSSETESITEYGANTS